MKHKIIVKVSPTGETELEVNGLKGKKCSDVTKQVEEALGKTKTSKKTFEYLQSDGQGQHIQGGA